MSEIPDRRCAHCPTIRRPRRWADYHNPNWCCSNACARAHCYPRVRAKLSAGTSIRNRRQARERVEAAVGRKYGELSIREIELFNRGVKVGYSRGYAKGYNARTRSKESAVA